MVRYLILPLWMLCFGLINYSAKRLVGAMPPLSKGAVELLSYFHNLFPCLRNFYSLRFKEVFSINV